MRNPSTVGGVSFHGGKIQVAAIEEQTVDSIPYSVREVEYVIPNELWLNPLQSPDAAAKLAEALSSAFDANTIPPKISVAIPSEAALLLVTPIDGSLAPHEVREQIDWELNNYHRGQRPQELTSNCVSLEKLGNNQTREILIVALQRGILQLLRTACEALKTQLHIVDIDHFCVEPLLAKNNPMARTENIILIGNAKNRTQVSVVAQSRLWRYRYGNGETDVQKIDVIRHLIGECHDTNVALQVGFLYGDRMEKSAFSMLESCADIPMNYVDTNWTDVPHSIVESQDVRDPALHPSRFAPTIGVAMRNE